MMMEELSLKATPGHKENPAFNPPFLAIAAARTSFPVIIVSK